MKASRSMLVGGLAASLLLGQPASGDTPTSGRKPALGGQIGSGGKTGSAGTAGQGQPSAAKAVRDYPVKPVPFTAVHFNDAFWAPRIEINRTVTIPFAFQKDEETGRIHNFERAAAALKGEELMDTDEFLRYCELIRTEPYICVNLGLGTIDDACHWVEYCNEGRPYLLGRSAAEERPRGALQRDLLGPGE